MIATNITSRCGLMVLENCDKFALFVHTTRAHWFYLILHGYFIMNSCKSFFEMSGWSVRQSNVVLAKSPCDVIVWTLSTLEKVKCPPISLCIVFHFPFWHIAFTCWWTQKRWKITSSGHDNKHGWNMWKQVGPFDVCQIYRYYVRIAKFEQKVWV